MFKNEMLFSYIGAFSVPTVQKRLDKMDDNAVALLVSGCVNLMSIGFMIDRKLYEAMENLSAEQISESMQELYHIANASIGNNHNHVPMYPNYPKQVIEADKTELILNAIVHYLSDGVLVPVYEKLGRPQLSTMNVKIITLGTNKEYHAIFERLMASSVILSDKNKKDLRQYLSEEDNVIIPDVILVKETAALVWKVLFETENMKLLQEFICTPTDILRLINVVSGRDADLNTFYCSSMTRRQRRVILSLLDKMKNPAEEMFIHKSKWLKAGNIIHPAEKSMQNQYPNAYKAFDLLRNGKPIKGYNSKLEKAFADNNLNDVLDLLKKRAGFFARNLDRVLRLAIPMGKVNAVASAFHSVAKDVSPRVLIQLIQHLQNRNNIALRSFQSKKSAVPYVIGNNLDKIDDSIIELFTELCKKALISIYTDRPYLGNVYIDPALEAITLPLSQQHASTSFKTLPIGSRMFIGHNANVIRFFLYWENAVDGDTEVRTDMDLSLVMYNDEFSKVCHVYYANLSNEDYAVHSGDFVDAPIGVGATEFIDIDINKALSAGVRYAVMSVNAFTFHKFDQMETCYAGWMEREDIESGEVFEPSTVEQMFHLSGENKNYPVVIDLVDRSIIWLDSKRDFVHQFMRYNNIIADHEMSSIIRNEIFDRKYMSLYELLVLHATARGMLVSNKEDADVVYSLDEGITPYDQSVLAELI